VVRYFSPEALERKAQEFLAAHHASLTIPVPIEEIVEFKLGLNIIPFPDLSKRFDVDGFLTFVPDSIYVDQGQLETQETRYRFTLAHEVGHWILHRDLYADAEVHNLEGYFKAYGELDDDALKDFEFQARNLGGRILLPEARCVAAAKAALPNARQMAAKAGQGANEKLVCGAIARLVADQFKVSHQVAETRLWGDELCKKLGMKGRRG